MNKLMVLGVAALMIGCASSTEDLIAKGDWYQVGYQEGLRGNTSRSVADLKQYSNVELSEYDKGYLTGVAEYCNPNFAYQIGLSGQYYEGVCEGMEEGQKFRMEWQRGWSEYNK
ncbi:DUF2799 domain-containing protein [Vibrio astriarenae]|uniref:DUF2799 domain-containing protein n=1 Tax=Vibrio agarivorans TaxID=153622 RepID=A0ABT7Y1W3_9VIBR|nr:DUF2799 domain-containing protein [Vibrio agarivorans]MDN2481970.1 DUF2799 domain-containing protein [Vibrio agarivorans]